MISIDIHELYQRHVRQLPLADRLRLAELIVHDAADQAPPAAPRSIMELHGLGAETWRGVDAQQYVNDLRREWDKAQ